tara:strand:+ start:1382 stop:3220 length:1839 start_codon:yes stop_codon:yes gene_type:complete
MSDTNVLATIDEMKENELFHSGSKVSAFLPEEPSNISNYSSFPIYRLPDSEVNWGKSVSFVLNNPNADYITDIHLEFTLPKVDLDPIVKMGYSKNEGIDANRLGLDDIQNQEELLGWVYPNYVKEMTTQKRPNMIIDRTEFARMIIPLSRKEPLDKTRIPQEQLDTLDEYIRQRYFKPGNLYRVRWIDNVGHYIMKSAKLLVDDIEYFSIDPFYMDIKRHFELVGGTNVYDKMVLHQDQYSNATLHHLDKYKLIIPLHFPITRNKNSLPISLIDKEIKITVAFATIEELLVIDNFENLSGEIDGIIEKTSDNYFPLLVESKYENSRIQRWKYKNIPITNNVTQEQATREDIVWDYFGRSTKMVRYDDWLDTTQPVTPDCYMNVNYSKVQDTEKAWIANAKLNYDIKYLSTDWSLGVHANLTQKKTRIPIRSKHLIKTIYFAIRNVTNGIDPSNYTTNALKPKSPTLITATNSDGSFTSVRDTSSPIEKVSLFYWKNARIYEIDSSYFTITQPYLNGLDTSDKLGIHMFSFSSDVAGDSLNGYANFEELGNVELEITLRDDALTRMNLTYQDMVHAPMYRYAGVFEKQKYEFLYGYESLCLMRYKEGSMFVFK